MRRFYTHRYHPHVHVAERGLPVIHQRLFLAAEDQHVARLGQPQRIAYYLAAADMGIQQEQRRGVLFQLDKLVKSVVGDFELMTGIHGKLVNHGLSENAVVAIGIPPRLQSAKASFLTEIPVGEPRTGTEYQGRGNHH